ncbi:MAG TPA: SpoIIE family protein phosphatase [Gaiellaceae bacterium]|nr:SpoIIE family protein phosphatase [Gaiellaceae bacterium]
MSAATAAPAELPEALAVLAEAGRAIAAGDPLESTLQLIAEGAALASGSAVALIWLRERSDELVARAVWSSSAALGAELEGLRVESPEAASAILAQRLGEAVSARTYPIALGQEKLGTLELLRFHGDPGQAAQLAADLAAVATSVCRDVRRGGLLEQSLVDVVGDALAAVSSDDRTAAHVARIAAIATRAEAALLWRLTADGLEAGASHGPIAATAEVIAAAESIVGERSTGDVIETPAGALVTLQLGQPAVGALQLLFPAGRAPALTTLTSLAVRVSHALREAERATELGLELERSRALLLVVGEAISLLSLTHTLETAVERVAALLDTDRVALYLEDDGVLSAAASRAIDGPHENVARAVLRLALAAGRGRGVVEVEDATVDVELAAADAAAAAEIGPVLAIPLRVQDEPIGLLAIYPRRPRSLTANESALLVALAGQLAVAVQNARLHEREKRLGNELEASLGSERENARRLRALYEISRSFAQSLSLETTLEVLAESIVTLLEVDAAVIRMPDERATDFVARAVHVNDQRVDAAAQVLLSRPQMLPRELLRDLLERGEPLILDSATAAELGGSLALLAPFLEKGSTAALIPISTASELLATLTIVSLHPWRPVAGVVADTALSIAGQAALAIDNARLYAQQKAFADTMQRSLLPREVPDLPELEIGDVYESAARVEVGGDVYDYLVLPDGRLAVVLGDVTGHGVEATADMAMAKFIFRSLARVHVDPGEFLAAANEVVASEIAPGKFITMVELVIDVAAGQVVCASAGHPPPRLVLPDGEVRAIDARGLALGIDAPQLYEPVTLEFPPGASVILYTDGVVEARRGGEQYGTERFDALLSERRIEAPGQIALDALAACREWTDGELTDDFAVVVIKRAA